jgi:hypothetical protein
MAADEHSRICEYANNALETLLSKQRHAERCPQCRIDPGFCKTSADFDLSFTREYEHWLANRHQGGIVARTLGPSITPILRTRP